MVKPKPTPLAFLAQPHPLPPDPYFTERNPLHYLGITGLEKDALENRKEAMKKYRLTADQGDDNAQARQSQMDKYRENKT